METASEFIVSAGAKVTKRGIVPETALRIKDGYIVEVNNVSRFSPDINVIDFSGYTVAPCFCDYHLHFFNRLSSKTNEIIEALISTGITTVYDGGDHSLYGLQMKEKFKKRLSVKTAGHALYKQGTYGKNIGRGVRNIKDAESFIDTLSNAGADYIKIVNSGIFLPHTGEISPGGFRYQELDHIVNYAKSKGMETACHANGESAVQEAVESGVSSIIHGLRISSHTIEQMSVKGTTFVPTLHAFARLSELEPKAHRKTALQETTDKHLSAVKNAFDAGVTVLPGSDSGPALLPYGSSYLKELLLFRKAGIPVDRILSSAAAGHLEKGKGADFLVLDGLQVVKIFIRGKCICD